MYMYDCEMKIYKCDELVEWLVYSSKWEALLIDNIFYMAAFSRNNLSVSSINQLTDYHSYYTNSDSEYR